MKRLGRRDDGGTTRPPLLVLAAVVLAFVLVGLYAANRSSPGPSQQVKLTDRERRDQPDTRDPRQDGATEEAQLTWGELLIEATSPEAGARCADVYRAGARVRVSGTAYAPSTRVDLNFVAAGRGDINLGVVTSDAEGTFSMIVQVPSSAVSNVAEGDQSAGAQGFEAVGAGEDGGVQVSVAQLAIGPEDGACSR